MNEKTKSTLIAFVKVVLTFVLGMLGGASSNVL